jgi:hypothetical protein
LLARGLDPHDEAANFAKLAPQRYECRARSRRKSIMKALAAVEGDPDGVTSPTERAALGRIWPNEAK